jgi:glycosyltransferase involved in cell wall biosynthesis
VKRIIYLVHSSPPAEYSGAPLVTQGYAHALSSRGWEVTVVAPGPGISSWAAVRTTRRPGEAFTRVEVPLTPYQGPYWSIEAPSHGSSSSPAAEGFRRILRHHAPDLVHVVDNVNLPLELPEVAKAAGVPVIRSVSCAEDLCGLIGPVSPCSGPAGYCIAPLTPEHCAACTAAVWPDLVTSDPRPVLESVPVPPDASDAEARDEAAWWRRRLVDRLVRKRARAVHQYSEVFDLVIFSTVAFRRYFEQTLPLDPSRTRVIPLGMDLSAWDGARDARRLRRAQSRDDGDRAPLVLCAAGLLDPVKGEAALVEAFTSPALRDRSDYRLRFLGAGDERLVAPLLRVNPNVELHGAYRLDELPSLLAEGDVGLTASYFESFHRVTREYLLAGLPVVASRALGVLDVVRDGVNGLLFDHADRGSLVRAVVTLLDDRELLDRLTLGASSTPVRSLESEADELAALYDEVRARGDQARRFATK